MPKSNPTPGSRTSTGEKPPVPVTPKPGHSQIRPTRLQPEDGVPAPKHDRSSFKPAKSSE
ncbi:MAG: hypothetical protein ACE37F_13060 [Nannocystaceae bacterium]|nr:hypothetical protein [bacterium]